MALVSNAAAAERIASEGVLTAYSSNFVSSAIGSGMIDVLLPELPAQRSPRSFGVLLDALNCCNGD